MIGLGWYMAKEVSNKVFTQINSTPIIRVINKGMIVRVFKFYFDWVFISWADITDVLPSPLVLHNGRLNWVIKARSLGERYSIIGKRYGDGSPAILINSYIKNRIFFL